MERHSFLRASEKKKTIKRNFYEHFVRYTKVPCKQVSGVSLRMSPTGEPERRGFTCQDVLREKKSISGFLSWTLS
jgi:hypothetical protein